MMARRADAHECNRRSPVIRLRYAERRGLDPWYPPLITETLLRHQRVVPGGQPSKDTRWASRANSALGCS